MLPANQSLSRALQGKGLDRRRFVKFCGAMVATLALPPRYMAQVAASRGGWFLAPLIGWLPRLIDIQNIRLIHFCIMFAFFAFVIHHVYSAVLVSWEERNGLIESYLPVASTSAINRSRANKLVRRLLSAAHCRQISRSVARSGIPRARTGF